MAGGKELARLEQIQTALSSYCASNSGSLQLSSFNLYLEGQGILITTEGLRQQFILGRLQLPPGIEVMTRAESIRTTRGRQGIQQRQRRIKRVGPFVGTGKTLEEISEKTGLSQATVSETLRYDYDEYRGRSRKQRSLK